MDYFTTKDKNGKILYWKTIWGTKKKRVSKKEAEEYFDSLEGKADKFKSEGTPFFFVEYEEAIAKEGVGKGGWDVIEDIDREMTGVFETLEEAKKHALDFTKKDKTLTWKYNEEKKYGGYTSSQKVEKSEDKDSSEIEETVYFDISIKDGKKYVK